MALMTKDFLLSLYIIIHQDVTKVNAKFLQSRHASQTADK